jgi:hypothetical protein
MNPLEQEIKDIATNAAQKSGFLRKRRVMV